MTTHHRDLEDAGDDLHHINPTHPFIRVLGEPVVDNARGPLEHSRRTTLTSMAVLMRLTSSSDPQVTEQQLTTETEPTADPTRWANLSRLRRWLGTTPDGEQYVPQLRDSAPHPIHDLVGLDWDEFRRLVPPRTETSVDNAHLVATLKLVHGQPFAGVLHTRYPYADQYTQTMITAITGAAHELARRALADHDTTTAQWATAKGLLASHEDERLIRDQLHLAHAS